MSWQLIHTRLMLECTQQDMACFYGVSQPMVSYWEETFPDNQTFAMKFCEDWNVSSSELIERIKICKHNKCQNHHPRPHAWPGQELARVA